MATWLMSVERVIRNCVLELDGAFERTSFQWAIVFDRRDNSEMRMTFKRPDHYHKQ